MELTTRRVVGRLIRAGLVMMAIVIAAGWIGLKIGRRAMSSHGPVKIVKVEAPSPDDVQITSTDGGVSLTLHGQQLLAGLSPQKVAQVRGDLEKSAARDTEGLGGSIAQIVKKTVAENINAQMAYSLADVSGMRYENGTIVLEHRDGKTQRLFESTKVEGSKPKFAQEDADRLIAAFRQRQRTF